MNCPKCNEPIAADKLACERCMKSISATAYRQAQLEPLRKIVAGVGGGRMTTRRINMVNHLQMIGVLEAFCGMPLTTAMKRGDYYFGRQQQPAICIGCKAALEKLVEEALCSAQ